MSVNSGLKATKIKDNGDNGGITLFLLWVSDIVSKFILQW